jgi:cytochrome c peroxidase
MLAALALATACGGGSEPGKAPKPKPAATSRYDDGQAAGGGAPINAPELLGRIKQLVGGPLPAVMDSPKNPVSDAKVALGKMLYFDARLSKNHDISCDTCHDLEKFGIDVREKDGARLATSLGHRGQPGPRNSPTVYNAALAIAQFWDGRAADVEEQALGPILNPVEMAMPDERAVVRLLKSIPGYAEPFRTAFPEDADPVTFANAGKAVAAFERKLVTPAPFDAFVAGKTDALDGQQLRGLQLFLDVGCTTCHTGPALGGGSFQKLGAVKPWPGVKDEGRFEVTKLETDRFMFKVPTLRNVTETAPYLHDGSLASLDDVVQKMSQHQLARGTLTPEEVAAIVAFLGSLRGELPRDLIAKPELPPSGPDTPAPDAG